MRNYRNILVSVLALVLLSSIFVLRPYAVTGGSMEPSYHEGDVLLVEALTPHFHVWRGEVLVLRNPHDHSVTEIKRVVGLPNEDVEMGNTGVTVIGVNGAHSQFVPGTLIGGTQNDTFRIQLGPEDYFVLGDNRSKSSDSRTFGAVQAPDIIGQVIIRL